MSVNPVNPSNDFTFQGATPGRISFNPSASTDTILTLNDYLLAVSSTKQELKETLDLIGSLDPLLRKDYYRALAERGIAAYKSYNDIVAAIRAQATLDQQFYNDEVLLGQLSSQFNVTDFNAARTLLNAAIATYNNSSPPGNPTAHAILESAIYTYNTNPAVFAALVYDTKAHAYNALVEANAETRAALGMPKLPGTTQYDVANEILALNNIGAPPIQLLPTPVPLTKIPVPITVLTPDQAVALYAPPFASSFQNSSSDVINLLNLTLYLQYITERSNNPTDITLPAAYIIKAPAAFFDGSSGLGTGASVSSFLSSSGLSSPFLVRLLSKAVYEDFMFNQKLPDSPTLVDQLQLFTAQLLSQTALATANSPSVQALADKTGVPKKVDSNFDITTALAFANNVRDLVESGVIAENVGRFIATNPEFAALSATEKHDLVAPFSAILSTSLLQVALSQVSLALGTPGLIPQLLANIPLLTPYSAPPTSLPTSAVPNTALINPLSLLFLKANLVAALAAMPLPIDLGGSETTQIVKAGQSTELLTTKIDMVNQAVNQVMVKAEQIGSEADLRTAFTDAFSKQGFTGSILSTLVDTAVSLTKADNALPGLDSSFTPTVLTSIAPLLSGPVPAAPSPSPTTPTPSLASVLSSLIVSDPSHATNPREAEAQVNSALNSVLAQGAFGSADQFMTAITQAFRDRGFTESLATKLGEAALASINANSSLTTPFSATALSALIPQLPINISPFAIPNTPVGDLTTSSSLPPTLANSLVSLLLGVPTLNFNLTTASAAVNGALNDVLTKGAFRNPEEFRLSLRNAFIAQGLTDPLAESLTKTTVDIINANSIRQPPNTGFSASVLSSFFPQLVSKTTGAPAPLVNALTSLLVNAPELRFTQSSAETAVRSALNTVLASQAFATPEALRASVTSAFLSQGLPELLAKNLAETTVNSITPTSLNPAFASTAINAMLPQIAALTNSSLPSAPAPSSPPPTPVSANVPPAVFITNPVRNELTNILATILINNKELTSPAAQNLINTALNNVLATPGVLNNATAALTGLVRTFRSLGVKESIATTLGQTTLDFIKRSRVIPELSTPFAANAVLATTESAPHNVPPIATAPTLGHAAQEGVITLPSKPGELPSSLNVDFPIGTPKREILLQLITEAQTRTEIGTAIARTLNAADSFESYRAFNSQLYLELLAGNVPAQDAIRIAEQVTKILQPNRENQPLLSPTPETILSPSQLAEELSNTIVGRLSPTLDIFKAGDVAGQIIRSIIGTHSLRSVLNEQARILKEDNYEDAIRALTKNTANLSTPNLNVPRFALKTNIIEAIKNRLEILMSSIPETDLRTRDTHKEPITFDKNIPYA